MLHERILIGLVASVLIAGGIIGWLILGKKPEKTAKPEPVLAPSQVKLDELDISSADTENIQDKSDEAITFQNKSLEYDGFAARNTGMNAIEDSVDRTTLFDEPVIGGTIDSGVMDFSVGTLGDSEVSRLDLNRKFGNGLAAPETQDLQELSKTSSDVHDYENWIPSSSRAKQNNVSIDTAKLMSFKRFGEPRVYLGSKPPTFKQLAEVAVTTRDATAREQSAMMALKRGKEIVVDDSESPTVVLTAIRAAEQCSKCHTASEGDLLGAFTYEFTATDQP